MAEYSTSTTVNIIQIFVEGINFLSVSEVSVADPGEASPWREKGV